MKLEEDVKKYLDSLSDEELMTYLYLKSGIEKPIWKRCSKKEYTEHCGNPSVSYKHLDINRIISQLCHLSDYKAVPVYKEWKGGILSLMELSSKEPDYYKYYKKKGTKKVIMIGSTIADYLNERGIKWK